MLFWSLWILIIRLDMDENWKRLCFALFFFFMEKSAISGILHCLVGSVHCSRDPQISFFTKIFIKNESHSTIHIFKNYFVTMFLVFNFQ